MSCWSPAMASVTELIAPILRLTVLGSLSLHLLNLMGKSLNCPSTQMFSNCYCTICITNANLTRARFPSKYWHLLQRRSRSTWYFPRWKCARSACSSYPPTSYGDRDSTSFYAREALPDHPLDVLCYAVKHEYRKLSQMAVPKTLSISLHDVSKALVDRPDIILKWVRTF
jgi:hypothetical protein